MDLNTITAVAHPQTRAQLPVWTPGDAWLAGGTWLFSEPQAQLTRLIDLTDLKWPALTITESHLGIAATCTVAQIDGLACPADWLAAPLISQCCRAFLASFKIWKTATVGGNLCMSLPAGPMISLTSALDGVCTIWKAGGGRTEDSRHRLRHRQPAQPPDAGRPAAADRYPDCRAEAPYGVSPDLARPGRPLSGTPDRQPR
ncbi:CO/xanthine dehydrogenase FAD-binding subunit [Bradyrhizobium japonicum]